MTVWWGCCGWRMNELQYLRFQKNLTKSHVTKHDLTKSDSFVPAVRWETLTGVRIFGWSRAYREPMKVVFFDTLKRCQKLPLPWLPVFVEIKLSLRSISFPRELLAQQHIISLPGAGLAPQKAVVILLAHELLHPQLPHDIKTASDYFHGFILLLISPPSLPVSPCWKWIIYSFNKFDVVQ